MPGLSEVLPILGAGVGDPWTWAQWLNTPLRGGDGVERRHIDRLSAGEVAGVAAAARRDAASWGLQAATASAVGRARPTPALTR